LAIIAFIVAMAAIASCGPTASPSHPVCAGSKPIPRTFVESGVLSTHLEFAQAGCSVGISSIDLYSDKHLVRHVAFNPPLPAGTLTSNENGHWAGKGNFHATTNAASVGGATSVTVDGTYKATSTVLMTQPRTAGPSKQWATDATASSELGSLPAKSATGAPATSKAWAPSSKDGTTEWLELGYASPVVPVAINIWESSGPGFVTKVEALNAANSSWVKLWEGTDPTHTAPRIFSPTLAKTNVSTNRIRLTVNTNAPDWNEVAAVSLVGPSQTPGQVIWLQGEWVESGSQSRCHEKKCDSLPVVDLPSRRWSFAFNTATGKVGTTPGEVS
jgi:hypothetical protein